MDQRPDLGQKPALVWNDTVLPNREEAGRLLAERLLRYRDDPKCMILALPRGGVAVGYSISVTLHLPLDVILTRKLGAPGNPEFAVGAVTEAGAVYLNPNAHEILNTLGASNDYLEEAVRTQRNEIKRRQELYRAGRPRLDPTRRTVILVDDGIATGATFLSAVGALRAEGVGRLIAAIPVGPAETLELVRVQVDALVVLTIPISFFAVANHYLDFTQVEDSKVLRYLDAAEASLHPRNGTLDS